MTVNEQHREIRLRVAESQCRYGHWDLNYLLEILLRHYRRLCGRAEALGDRELDKPAVRRQDEPHLRHRQEELDRLQRRDNCAREAPIEIVFDVLTDHRGYKRFAPLRAVKLEQEGTPAPNGVGAIRALHAVGPPIREQVTELQDQYGMVPSRGPFRFACDGTPPRDVVVTWFETDPPSGILESDRGSTTIFATQSGSGARYVGDNVAFWEHQGGATVTWGADAREISCAPKKG